MNFGQQLREFEWNLSVLYAINHFLWGAQETVYCIVCTRPNNFYRCLYFISWGSMQELSMSIHFLCHENTCLENLPVYLRGTLKQILFSWLKLVLFSRKRKKINEKKKRAGNNSLKQQNWQEKKPTMNKLEVRISRLKSMNAFRWLLKRAFYSRVRFYRDQMTAIFPACSRLSWRFRENDVWRSEIETSIFLAVIIKPFVIHLVVEKTQSKPTQWRTVNEQLMNRREEEDIKSRFKITKKKR